MSKQALILICMSFIRLAGTGVIDDLIDVAQYVGVLTSTEYQNTTSDQANFLGEREQKKRNDEDKKRILIATQANQDLEETLSWEEKKAAQILWKGAAILIGIDEDTR